MIRSAPRLASKKAGVSIRMSIKRVPKWVWWVAAVLIALQMYFFQELVAAYLIFGILFGSFLILLLAVYLVERNRGSRARLGRGKRPRIDESGAPAMGSRRGHQ